MKDMEGLSIICAGLGFAEEDDNGASIGYSKDEFCLDNLKDLQRFLRRDDPQRRDVFKQICKWNTVPLNLVPIIENYQSDRNLVLNAVKVLVFLTMPIDPASNDIAQQMECLWDLKAALTRSITIAVIVSLLEDPLDHLECDAFTDEDWKLVQLVLTLFRNILAIHDITLQQKASGLASRFICLTDRSLEIMFQENVMDLILVLTQHLDSSGYLQEDNLLLLETFHYIFQGRDPEMIAKMCNRSRKADQSVETSVNSLKLIMDEEKKGIIGLRNSECHSQIGGTFTRLTMDGSRILQCNPDSASRSRSFKFHNIQRGPQKKLVWDSKVSFLPQENVLESLYDFLNQFLSGGFNVLMRSVGDDIRKEHQSIQKNDVVLFFGVSNFVLAFQHQKVLNLKKLDGEAPISDDSTEGGQISNLLADGDVCGPVAATINEGMFNLVISKWFETFEGLKETNDYKSLSAAGSLMKNMIRLLDLVLKLLPEDSKEAQTARVLLYKVFYDQTERGLTQFLFNLFRLFDSHRQPKSDLADLLEMIHVILRLMEKLQSRGTLRVARRSRKGRKKKSAEAGNTETKELVEPTDKPNPDDQTEENEDETSQSLVKLKDLTTNLLHDVFSTDREPESRCNIFSNQDPEISRGPENERCVDDAEGVSVKMNTNLIDLGDEKEVSSSEDQLPVTSEFDFNISKLVASFANSTVAHNLCWLLRYYKSNSVSTNHHIICMLQRFCDDLEMSPILYQLSILKIFYDILAELHVAHLKKENDILAEQRTCMTMRYANITSFLTKFIRKMLKLMKKQPLIFVEILFWKTRRECLSISADSSMCDITDLKKDIRDWAGDGVAMPNEKGPLQKSVAESLGDDEADLILPDDPNGQRMEDSDEIHDDDFGKCEQTSDRGGITRSIPNIDMRKDTSKYISSEYHNKTTSRRRKTSGIDQEQEIAIKDLYERYKDERKCTRLIAEALDPECKITPSQVYRKLKQLGLKTTKKKSAVLSPSAVQDALGSDLANETDSNSLLNKSPRRTRVQAFDKAQENKIKALSEQKKRPLKIEDKSVTTSKFKEMAVEDDSGDETLSSLLKRRRKKTKSLKEDKLDNNSQKKILSAEAESDKTLSSLFQHSETPADQDEMLVTDLDDDIPAKPETSTERENNKDLDSLDLIDSEDDVGSAADRKKNYRRNLKIVIDEEEE